MKKILFTLLICLFMIPRVNAFTILENPLDCFSIAKPSSTKNMYDADWGTSEKACGYVNRKWYQYSTDDLTTIQYLCNSKIIEVEPNTTYTFTHFNSSYSPINSPAYNPIYTFDEDFNDIGGGSRNWYSPPYNFTTGSDIKYILYCAYSTYANLPSNVYYQLELGAITSTSDLSFVEYQEYVEEPIIPDEPIIADTTLDGFYTIYVSKLQDLTEYVMENKFLLGTLAIILLFAISELILNLFRKGGYR